MLTPEDREEIKSIVQTELNAIVQQSMHMGIDGGQFNVAIATGSPNAVAANCLCTVAQQQQCRVQFCPRVSASITVSQPAQS
jgi:hypothetical protein